MSKTKHIDFQFKAKSEEKGVVIEGFANKKVVDRGNDLVDSGALSIDRYKQNPIILFNHNSMMPVGKALEIENTDEGVKLRALLSNSDVDHIKGVRDLVKEGILNSFSIGFDVQEETKNEEGVNVISKGELLEVSIVGIPMNQDSQFGVINKGITMQKGLHEVCEELNLDESGFKITSFSELITTKLIDAHMTKTALAEKCGLSISAISQMCSGDIKNPKEKNVRAIAEALDMSEEEVAPFVKQAEDNESEPTAAMAAGDDETNQVEAPMVSMAKQQNNLLGQLVIETQNGNAATMKLAESVSALVSMLSKGEDMEDAEQDDAEEETEEMSSGEGETEDEEMSTEDKEKLANLKKTLDNGLEDLLKSII